MRYKTQTTLPSDAQILVIKLAGIGDLLLATPALQALRDSYPQARIDLLVTPDSAGLLNGWKVIDNIIVLDKYLFDRPQQIIKQPQTLLRLKELWQTLRAGRYDAVLLLHHLTLPFGRLKHQLLMRATGTKWRVGLDNGHGWFLNVRVQDRGFGAMHEAEYAMAIAEAVGAPAKEKHLILPLSATERQQARQIVYGDDNPQKASSRPLIAFHPGSGGYSLARRWAPERFAQLAETLYHDFGGEIILLGGPEEKELHQKIIGQISSAVSVRSLAGKGSIKTTAAILELVDVFVGNDAGVMHLAAAVGAPTVAIFSLSNADAWGPYTGEPDGKRATIVRLDLPCMPCFYSGHLLGTPEGCATHDCITQLAVDPVAAATRKMLRDVSKYKRQTAAER